MPVQKQVVNNRDRTDIVSLLSFQLFCSPFRMWRKRKEEVFLTKEEAWQMYFNKLDEEANYFTVTEETEEDICTCSTCIVSNLSE